MKRLIIHKLPCFLSAAFIFSLNGCTKPPAGVSLEAFGTYFDTIISIKIWGGDEKILDRCKEMCSHYEQLFSRTIKTSDISRINAAKDQG